MNFVQNVISGEASLTEIDDYIESWHLSISKVSINQYLGMTQREYYDWVEDPRVLKHIIDNYRTES